MTKSLLSCVGTLMVLVSAVAVASAETPHSKKGAHHRDDALWRVVIVLKDGRQLAGMIDRETDERSLWLRDDRPRSSVSAQFLWSQIESVWYQRERVSTKEIPRLVETLQTEFPWQRLDRLHDEFVRQQAKQAVRQLPPSSQQPTNLAPSVVPPIELPPELRRLLELQLQQRKGSSRSLQLRLPSGR